jgi:hypothetical protein
MNREDFCKKCGCPLMLEDFLLGLGICSGCHMKVAPAEKAVDEAFEKSGGWA